MKVDQARADAWYLAISDFLEAQAGQQDADAPGSLVTALCRVLADAMEGVEEPNEKKLEAIVRLAALSLGLEDKFLILKDPTGPVN
jgi:hypothetical protein